MSLALPERLEPPTMVERASPAPREIESEAHARFLSQSHFASLNGLRCFSCLAVIEVHSIVVGNHASWISHGWIAVDLFFTISGFLIVTLLLRERRRRGRVSLKNFYVRRSLRIFPIYYLMIAGVFLFYLSIAPWRPGGLRYYAWTFPILLTYTQDLIPAHLGSFFHCWSLAMEEQFYLFWPALVKFASARLRWIVFTGLLLFCQVVNFGLLDTLIVRLYGDPKALSLPVVMCTFTPILLGVWLAHLLHDRKSFGALYRVVGYRWSPFLFAALMVAIDTLAPEVTRGGGRLLMQLNFALLIASVVIREDHLALPILSFPPIARLGVITYGLYVYHPWIVQFVQFIQRRLHWEQPNQLLVLLLVLSLSIVVAEFSFRVIEEPLLRLKTRFPS
jgi:peptidoglycan/LPS O-acetylase OafA/YrhL